MALKRKHVLFIPCILVALACMPTARGQTVGGLPDTDSDGLPDWWEQQYFGGTAGVAGGDISGNDGLTYLQTYIAGVSPTNFDPFVVSTVSGGNGLRWNPVPSRLYSVDWTSSLTNGFTLLQGNIPYSQAEFIDLVHSGANAGFYRLKALVQYWDTYAPNAALDEGNAGPNVYAPDLLWGGGNWVCFYGGTLTNHAYHDRIAVTISNGADLSSGWGPSGLIIDVPPGAGGPRGDNIMDLANDPSVIELNGVQYMVYTAAYEVYNPTGGLTGDIADECICWASNSIGNYVIGWTPSTPQADHECIIRMGGDMNYFSDVGRPALATDGTNVYLYFDGRTGNDPNNSESYCAQYTESQGSHLVFDVVRSYGAVGPGFGTYLEPDVEYDSSTGIWWMVYQRFFSHVYRAYSTNGLDWVDDDILLQDLSVDGMREMLSNPGIIWDQSAPAGCMGTAVSTSWDMLMTHKINFYE